jgi:hypothetical protein
MASTWFQISTNSTYVPNSTIDSLIIDRVVSLNVTNMGIICIIIALLSVIIFYNVIQYLKLQPKF